METISLVIGGFIVIVLAFQGFAWISLERQLDKLTQAYIDLIKALQGPTTSDEHGYQDKAPRE